jgi:hypothetical protein
MGSHRMQIKSSIFFAAVKSRTLQLVVVKELIRSGFWLALWRKLNVLSSMSVELLHASLPIRLTLNALLIIAFGILHTADGVVTYLGLHFNVVDEANPVLNFVAGHMGLGYSIFLMKLLCLDVLFVLYRGRHKMHSVWNTAALASAVVFYCWVVSNNVVLVTNV